MIDAAVEQVYGLKNKLRGEDERLLEVLPSRQDSYDAFGEVESSVRHVLSVASENTVPAINITNALRFLLSVSDIIFRTDVGYVQFEFMRRLVRFCRQTE